MKYFIIKVCILLFLDICYCTLIRLQYSVNMTLYALGNPKIRVTHFIVIFALSQWSSTKPAVSPRYACTNFSQIWQRHGVEWFVERMVRKLDLMEDVCSE